MHVRSLEGLGFGGDKYGLFLTPLILSKLPAGVRLEWAREGAGKDADLSYLLEFLAKEMDRRERSGALAGSDNTPGPAQREQRQQRFKRRQPSAAALQAVAESCGFCAGPHPAGKCSSMDSLTVSDRHQRIKAAGLCFICLKKGHMAKACSARCSVCQGRHHKLVCFKEHHVIVQPDVQSVPEGVPVVGKKEAVNSVSASLSCVRGRACTVLPTASVLVQGPNGSVQATVLFDSGSDRSYVSSSLVKKVGAKWVGSQESSYVAFGGGKSGASHCDVYELRLSGAHMANPAMHQIRVMEVPLICAPLQRPRVMSSVLKLFSNLELADTYESDRQMSVDILIGLDLFWTLMVPGRVQSAEGLVAQLSVFGWVISGLVQGSLGTTAGCQLLTLGDLHESVVRNLWSLEGVGICETEATNTDVLSNFDASVLKVDGRYEVKLPWKEGAASALMANRESAELRLAALSRKLAKDPDLQERYDAALQDMEQAGVIAEVSPEELSGPCPYPTFYLPHRPVVKESSSTTKVRPVFDASASGPNGLSLNDCLEVGPCLLPNLVEVLLRFRRWPVAVTADVTKAFLQIRLSREDQDSHRFLWACGGRTRVMRSQRVIFGVSSSPFLLNATIRHHLSTYPDSPLITEMRENFYVDDFLSGANSVEEASELLSQAQSVMSEAGMTLTKCRSNRQVSFDKAHAAPGGMGEESVKVLGVTWLPSDDALTFQGVCLPSDIVPTKRVALSVMARLFDPLGFLTPFIMTLKCMFQELPGSQLG